MGRCSPRLYADDQGVWREGAPGQRFGLAWDEIEWLRCVGWEDGDGAAAITVQLYAKNGGIGLDLNGQGAEADALALDGVVAAMAARLGLPGRWYADLRQRRRGDGAALLWARIAPPRIHADDRGLWCHEFDQFTAWGRIAGLVARKAQDGALTIELGLAAARDDEVRDVRSAGPGFAECVRAMAVRLPGMPADWLQAAHALAPGEAAALWRRSYPEGYPRLSADDLGVCREDQPDHPVDLAWDAIDRVLACKREGCTEIELVSTDGMRLLLRSDWEGFAEVVDAMAASLPHLPSQRLARIGLLKPGHALWRRGWAIAGEELEPDGMLATAWQRIET